MECITIHMTQSVQSELNTFMASANFGGITVITVTITKRYSSIQQFT